MKRLVVEGVYSNLKLTITYYYNVFFRSRYKSAEKNKEEQLPASVLRLLRKLIFEN